VQLLIFRIYCGHDELTRHNIFVAARSECAFGKLAPQLKD